MIFHDHQTAILIYSTGCWYLWIQIL